MNNLRPSTFLGSVAEINYFRLLRVFPGLDGVMFDLDKTLVGQYEEEVPEEHMEALILISGLGLRLGIISNAGSEDRTQRVRQVAKDIERAVGDDVPVVTSYMVGGKVKPFRPVFDAMASKVGIKNSRLCYVGDQLLKDVLGANRAGYGGSILVAPYGSGDDPGVRYLQRPIEAAIRRSMGLPLFYRNFSK